MIFELLNSNKSGLTFSYKIAEILQFWGTVKGPTLIRYRSAAANIIIDIGGDGVAGAPKNLSRRRLGLFSIGGGVHISK